MKCVKCASAHSAQYCIAISPWHVVAFINPYCRKRAGWALHTKRRAWKTDGESETEGGRRKVWKWEKRKTGREGGQYKLQILRMRDETVLLLLFSLLIFHLCSLPVIQSSQAGDGAAAHAVQRDSLSQDFPMRNNVGVGWGDRYITEDGTSLRCLDEDKLLMKTDWKQLENRAKDGFLSPSPDCSFGLNWIPESESDAFSGTTDGLLRQE